MVFALFSLADLKGPVHPLLRQLPILFTQAGEYLRFPVRSASAFGRLDFNVLSAPERAYQVIPNAANRPERSAVDILIVEDRRRQLVVNNDVGQVAD